MIRLHEGKLSLTKHMAIIMKNNIVVEIQLSELKHRILWLDIMKYSFNMYDVRLKPATFVFIGGECWCLR